MADNNSFSISKKGYNCTEVDEYVSFVRQSETQLRESYASLQEKYDTLAEENLKMHKDCTALALALQKLRETAITEDTEALGKLREENEALKAENTKLKSELETARQEGAEVANFYGTTASKMIEEVAQIVQKFEKDAQRKAEAITAAARLEQEKTILIKEQVNHEIRSLMSMLGSFAKDTENEGAVEVVDETDEDEI